MFGYGIDFNRVRSLGIKCLGMTPLTLSFRVQRGISTFWMLVVTYKRARSFPLLREDKQRFALPDDNDNEQARVANKKGRVLTRPSRLLRTIG